MPEPAFDEIILNSRNKFRAFVDAIPDALAVVDENLIVRGANWAYARWHETEPARALDRAFGPPEGWRAFDWDAMAMARQAMSSGEARRELACFADAAGRERWFSAIAAPFPAEPGRGSRAVLVLRDVTREREMELSVRRHAGELEERVRERTEDLRQALERLRESEALKRDLFNMIVHDLKSPLAQIMANLDMLAGLRAWDGDSRQMLESAQIGCNDMALMIANLLDVERMESNRLKLRFAPVDSVSVARRVEERLRPVAALRGIRVEVLAAGSVPAMPLDGSLFERVAQNLLSNAIEHSPDGERVTLELRFEPRPPGLAMRVEDRGPGVPPGEREAIFEKFRQGRTRAGAGSGLGLAFCKLALDAHHGSIAVEEGEAGGARFVAFWPLLALDGSPATN